MQNIWGKEMRAMKDDRFLKFTLSLSRMNKKVQAVKTAGMGMVGLKAAHTAVLYALSGHSQQEWWKNKENRDVTAPAMF